MTYSKIKVELIDGSIEEHKTVSGFATVTPVNGGWNFYDLIGVLHSWNWNVIKKITVVQVKDETS